MRTSLLNDSRRDVWDPRDPEIECRKTSAACEHENERVWCNYWMIYVRDSPRSRYKSLWIFEKGWENAALIYQIFIAVRPEWLEGIKENEFVSSLCAFKVPFFSVIRKFCSGSIFKLPTNYNQTRSETRHGSTWINNITTVGQSIDTLSIKLTSFMVGFRFQPRKIKFPFHEYCRLRDQLSCDNERTLASTQVRTKLCTHEIYGLKRMPNGNCFLNVEFNSRLAQERWKCQRCNDPLNVTVNSDAWKA